MFFHDALKLFLVIYVDDFKLSGPDENLKKAWTLIQGGIHIEPPQTINAEGATYLGCRQIMGSYHVCVRTKGHRNDA